MAITNISYILYYLSSIVAPSGQNVSLHVLLKGRLQCNGAPQDAQRSNVSEC